MIEQLLHTCCAIASTTYHYQFENVESNPTVLMIRYFKLHFSVQVVNEKKVTQLNI